MLPSGLPFCLERNTLHHFIVSVMSTGDPDLTILQPRRCKSGRSNNQRGYRARYLATCHIRALLTFLHHGTATNNVSTNNFGKLLLHLLSQLHLLKDAPKMLSTAYVDRNT